MDPFSNFVHRLFESISSWLGQGDHGSRGLSAAEAAGLSRIRRTSFLGMTTGVEGWAGPLRVDIRPAPNRPPGVRIRVRGIARWLHVQSEGVTSRVQKRLGLESDVETGDDLFDRDFLVQGLPALAHALLDADTRTAVRRFFSFSDMVEVGEGELVADFSETSARAFLEDELAQVAFLGRRLVEPADLPERIARNALEDRAAGVRRQCLLALLEGHAGHPATRETLRRACTDASEEVRLEAALAFEESGAECPTLRALASGAVDEMLAARASRALGARLEMAEALRLLEASLDRRRHTVAVACIEVLGDHGRASADAERVLIEPCLVHDDEGVRQAAAAALGRVGTVAAVLPLQEAAQAADGASRRAMQEAARAIQSRLQGAERGQLTVAGAEGGTVTLAADGGEVSLPDPDRSRGE